MRKRSRVVRDPWVSIIADWFGLPNFGARIVWVLYEAQGPVSSISLMRRTKCRASILGNRLREVTEAFSTPIGRQRKYEGHGRGRARSQYWLTEANRREVRAALKGAADRLTAEGVLDQYVYDLEAKIIALEDALGLSLAPEVDQAFGLTATEAKIYAVLNKGGLILHERLALAVWGDNPPQSVASLMGVNVCKMRLKLAKHGIAVRNVWGQGYILEKPQSVELQKAA